MFVTIDPKPGLPHLSVGGKYVPAKIGVLIRCKKDRHRPSAMALVHGRGGLHIDFVDIWAVLLGRL